MQRRHRIAHRRLWLALAVLFPVLGVVTVMTRSPSLPGTLSERLSEPRPVR
ncbi:MAG: hypothetical protein WCH83_16030 [Alphaproteobacteria bacterium]